MVKEKEFFEPWSKTRNRGKRGSKSTETEEVEVDPPVNSSKEKSRSATKLVTKAKGMKKTKEPQAREGLRDAVVGSRQTEEGGPSRVRRLWKGDGKSNSRTPSRNDRVDRIPAVTPNSNPVENNTPTENLPIEELIPLPELGNVNRGNLLVRWLLCD